MLGASFDSVSDNAAFAKKFRFPFPLLCDEKREVGLAYGACDSADAGAAKRISYLIGQDGTILQAYPKATPATHPQETLDALAAS